MIEGQGNRWLGMVVRSWRRHSAGAVFSITLLSMLMSVMIAWAIASLLDRRLDVVLALGVPAICAPFFVFPLVRANMHLYHTRAELEQLVGTDPLTGLANRRSFLAQATSLFSSSARKGDVAVMMIDVDHFKRINDRCGHDSGDQVLKLVASALVSVAEREYPGQVLVGRIGGEEFAVLAQGLDASHAVALAESVCETMRRLECVGCLPGPTVSIGIAMRDEGETFPQVLKVADTAVYEAKAQGRDRWCIANQDASLSLVLPIRHRPYCSSALPARLYGLNSPHWVVQTLY